MAGDKEFKTEFVGRATELDYLKNLMNKSIANEGQFAVISGEAGIGKTRLVGELKKYAISKNTRCLEGSSTYHDVSDPYLPFLTALSDITEPSIIDDSQKYVTIDEAFLINNAGIVVSYASRIGANILSEDIIGAMLTAVESFVADAFGAKQNTAKGLDTLAYGTTRIMIEHGELIFLAVVLSGEEPEGLREDLIKLVTNIEKNYLYLLSQWDGTVSKVKEITKIIQDLTKVKYRTRLAIKDVDIKKEKNRVFERTLQIIIEASEKEPIFIILEDIHWADISSLQLLQYVARNTKDKRVFICATYRPEELEDTGEKKVHPLKEALLRMSRHKMFIPMELSSLNEPEVIQMLASNLGTLDFPMEFKDRIYMETEGNPFYVEEMLYTFRDEGVISHVKGAWQFHNTYKSIIPSTIKDLITLRIERLDSASIDTVKYASVLGKEFEFNVVGMTMPINDEELIGCLDNLEANNLITVDPENDELYQFNHNKIREVVYDGIGSHRKRMIHEKAAIALKNLNKDNLDDVVYKLAHHYSKTKDYNNALNYSILAQEKAVREFALDEAYNYMLIAKKVLDQIEDNSYKKEKKLMVLSRLGDICFAIGEWDFALEYMNELVEYGQKTGDIDKIFGGYFVIGNIHLSRCEWDLSKENLEKGLEIVKKNNDFRGMADCLYILGALHEKRGDFHGAIKYYEDSMKGALSAKDNFLIGTAYLGMGRVYAQQGQYQNAIEHMQKSVEIFEEIGDLNELAKAHINLGHAYLCQDAFDESILYYEKAIEWARKTKNIRLEGHGLSNLGESYIKKNELEKAINCLDRALGIFEKLDEKFMISDVYRHYGCVHKLKHEWDSSTEYFNNSIGISRELNMPYYVGCGLLEFGLMYKAKGDLQNARKQLNQAHEIFKVLDNQEMVKKIEEELETLDIEK
jgi:tetratricopeptide (TPR) repeat protein